MDMHETDSRVTQPHISWGDFFGRWSENGRITWFYTVGYCGWRFRTPMSVPQGETLRFNSNQKHSNPLRNPLIMSHQMWAAFVLGWRRWEAVRTRLKHFKNNAWEFSGISLWQKVGHRILEKKIPVGQPIGQLLRTEVRVFSDRFVWGKQQRLSESDMDDKTIWNAGLVDMRGHLRYHGQTSASSIGTFLQATPRSKSREKFRLSWDPRNRGISEAESYSCLCSTTLNIRNQVMSKNVSKTQERLPNMQNNSS